MPGTPLMFSSNGCTTAFMMVLASAPVYDVETRTVGGAMFGYCSMGSVLMQIKPTSVMTIAIAHAITYLLIKMFPFMVYFSFFDASGNNTCSPSCTLFAPTVTILSPTFKPLVTMKS